MSTAETARGVPKDPCDLVMKGGITSGVVYPSAIIEITKKYRLLNIGGASAGAIAAVVAAACEYRRQGDLSNNVQPDPAAFQRLNAVTTEITEQGFIQRLFQPTAAGKAAFDIGLAFVTSQKPKTRKIVSAGLTVLRRAPWLLLLASLLVAAWLGCVAFGVWAVVDGAYPWMGIVALVLFGILFFPVMLALVVPVVLWALARFAVSTHEALTSNFLGLVPGHNPTGDPAALTDWLHTTIQECAGLPADKPLTFRMLKGSDEQNPVINLRLITTDLSYSRPVDLPWTGKGGRPTTSIRRTCAGSSRARSSTR